MYQRTGALQKHLDPDRQTSRDVSRSRSITGTEELARYFRSQYPILVDGVLPRGSDQGHFIRQARESLARGKVDPDTLPAALLREALETIKAKATPSTKAGITTIGPRRARVWWDNAVLERVDDVLAGLDKPRLILRFYDITGLDSSAGQWNDSFDMDVALGDTGLSVDFWAADRVYVVELGIIHADGRFLRLARTNTTALPRESAGNAHDGQSAVSRLVPRGQRFHRSILPDRAAKQWVDARQDNPARDIQAETIIHMLYRAFLLEGPRALRNAPKPSCRDAETLYQEFLRRGKSKAQITVPSAVAPALLVARLDEGMEARRVVVRYPLLAASVATLPIQANAILLAAFAAKKPGRVIAAEQPVAPAAAMSTLVRQADTAEQVVATLAEPVFKAAAALRRQLSRLESDRPGQPVGGKPVVRINRFGPDEAKRFAKAGARIEQMALTLEGRMRPGARLKVAGKIVRADANGRFRLDCVVAGGKAVLPGLITKDID